MKTIFMNMLINQRHASQTKTTWSSRERNIILHF